MTKKASVGGRSITTWTKRGGPKSVPFNPYSG